MCLISKSLHIHYVSCNMSVRSVQWDGRLISKLKIPYFEKRFIIYSSLGNYGPPDMLAIYVTMTNTYMASFIHSGGKSRCFLTLQNVWHMYNAWSDWIVTTNTTANS